MLRQIGVVGLFILGLAMGTSVFGQGRYELFKDEIKLTRAVIQTERKAIVQENMILSEEERQKFWPLYNHYRAAMSTVNDRKVRLITDYADSYVNRNLSDEKALALLNEFLAIEKDKLKVKNRYVRRFRKVLPPKKVVRFFQIDNKLEALVNAALAKDIPLMR